MGLGGGFAVLGNDREDVGFVTIGYDNGVIANIHASWVDPFKVRQLVVVGTQERILFDDVNPSQPVTVVSRGVRGAGPRDVEPHAIREGADVVPVIAPSEPLKNQSIDFLDAIDSGREPVADRRDRVASGRGDGGGRRVHASRRHSGTGQPTVDPSTRMNMTLTTRTTPIPFVDLKAQYASIRDEVDAAIADVLGRANFILGDHVEAFEDEFSRYCGVAHGVGVDSGTSALELALRAVGVGPTDEVITVANTFIASALAISYVGATPVLVDMDPATYQIDVSAIERAITPRTKAIMPVHLYGHPADMTPIMDIAQAHGLVVVEDASQAHGARYRGERVGSFGDVSAFSLYPGKNLGAYGDAGIVVTNDSAVADRVRMDRNYGSRQKYIHESIGFNRRLDTLQAAVLRVKLARLDEWNAARRRHAAAYNERLSGVVTLPGQAADVEPVHHIYPVCVDGRDEVQRVLGEAGVASVIHYPIPIHLQQAYAGLGHGEGTFPETEDLARRELSLPMFPELEDAQIDRVCEVLVSAVASHRDLRGGDDLS